MAGSHRGESASFPLPPVAAESDALSIPQCDHGGQQCRKDMCDCLIPRIERDRSPAWRRNLSDRPPCGGDETSSPHVRDVLPCAYPNHPVELQRMELYLVVIGVVLLVNLMPAFGPPTALVLVLFKLNWQLEPVALVVIGAFTSGLGRYLLATATGRVRERLRPQRVASLQAAGDYLSGHRGRSLAGLTLFLLSPLPSAQLFEAAGLMGVRLLPLTAAHVLGRLVSYSLYLGAATVAERNLGATLSSSITSPWGVAVQIALLAGLVLLARVDWTRYLPHTATAPDG